MATRTKTLWYATAIAATVSDAVLTALTQITIYTENSSRVFRAVKVWVSYEDESTVTGATIGEHRVACSVAGAGATTITETDDITNTGENMGGILGPFDFTSHFTTNYPAADSTTLDLSVYFDVTTGTGLNVRNVSALIAITYEYDDSAATQYATAIIPMESTTGTLATTETEIGTNQIPQLTGSGGILENVAGVTVRQQFFVTEGNSGASASATDYTFNIRIDTGTTHTFGITENALASDRWVRYIHIESPSAGSAHAFKAWASGVASLAAVAHTMFVTYQFTVSGTTEFLNSLLLPFTIPPPLGGTTSSDNYRAEVEVWIEEPATITMKQSAVRLCYLPGSASMGGLNLRVGGQSYRAYTDGMSMVTGGTMLQQRFDSGGAQGSGHTLTRGRNKITIDAYRTDGADLGYGLSGMVILNYKSGVSSQGIGAHNHSTIWNANLDWDSLGVSTRTSSSDVAPVIPETNYWINCFAAMVVFWDGSGNQFVQMSVEQASGEGSGQGFRQVYADIMVKDAERGCHILHIDMMHHFRRWPGDTDMMRMDPETARGYRWMARDTCFFGMCLCVTYHSISFTIDGTISGSGGGTVTINAYSQVSADERIHIGETTRSGNGAYSITWFDNAHDSFVEVDEDSTHLGRSDSGVANGTA